MIGSVDDPYELTESTWRGRFSRRLAAERGVERARARGASLAAAAALDAPPVSPGRQSTSPAQLAQLARIRVRVRLGTRAYWHAMDAAARRAYARALVQRRWARSTAEEHHQLAVALNHARWHRIDPKAAPGGGRYR